MAKEESQVLYLEKDRLFFYDGERILKVDFPPEVVKDLDVINEESLIALITQFVDKSKITPSGFITVLSESTLFSVESTEKDLAKLELQFQDFVGLVPFDQVLAKKYQSANGVRMVATNQQLIDIICDLLESRGFVKDGVVPAFIFGDIGVKKGFDVDTAKIILQNKAVSRGATMVVPTAFPIGTTTKIETPQEKSKLLPILLGVLGLGLVVLILILFLRR